MNQKELQQVFEWGKRGMALGWSVDTRHPKAAQLASVFTQLGGILSHIEIILRKVYDEQGKVIDLICAVADGKIVKEYSVADRLKDCIESTSLYLMWHYASNAEDRENIAAYAEKEIALGVIYNWDIIAILARKTIISKIPLFGFLYNKWCYTTPPFDKKELPGTVCSKSYVKAQRWSIDQHNKKAVEMQKIDDIQPLFMQKNWVDYISPSLIFEDVDMSVIRP